MRKNYIPCITWIAKGVAKTQPDKIQLSSNDLKRLIEESQSDIRDAADSADSDEEISPDGQIDAEEEEIKKDIDDFESRYGLENYDDEDDGKPLMNFCDVVVHVDNKDDEYIADAEGVSDDEREEEEDFIIKPDDNLIVVGHVKAGEEDEDNEEEPDSIAVLEIYVYNKEEGSLYVHHDIVLPAFPLALEWLNFHPSDDTPGNFVAVGDMTNIIKIWDIDVVDVLEPDLSLGEKIKKKDKQNKKNLIKGHKDAVLSLSWNKQLRNTLASGSVDTCVVLWDLQEARVQNRMADMHTGRVQGLQWNPSESFLLLSGCSDGIVKLYDTRTSSAVKSWKVDGEVEKVCWNDTNTEKFYCATDQGFVYTMNIKNDEIENSKQLHLKGITDLDMSNYQKHILMTASVDKTIKIWNVEEGFELVSSQKLKVGSIYTAKFAPDNELVVAVGGDNKSNNFKVLDVGDKFKEMKLEEESASIKTYSSPLTKFKKKDQTFESNSIKSEGPSAELETGDPSKKFKKKNKKFKLNSIKKEESRANEMKLEEESAIIKTVPSPSKIVKKKDHNSIKSGEPSADIETGDSSKKFMKKNKKFEFNSIKKEETSANGKIDVPFPPSKKFKHQNKDHNFKSNNVKKYY